jgi:cytochrome P450
VPTLVVSSPRAAEAVLRTHDHVLSSRPWSPVADILFYGARSVGFAPYGDEWRLSRKVVAARMLSARKVESFRRGRLDEVRVVLAKVREAAAASAADGTGTGTAVDVSELVSAYANDVVCRAVLGESHRAGGLNRLLMALVNMNVALLGGFNLEDYFPRLTRMELLRRLICAQAKRVHRRWDQLFDDLIHEHQQAQQQDESTTEDLIHVLLAAEEEYGLTRDNVKALLMVSMWPTLITTKKLQHILTPIYLLYIH